MLKTFMRSCSCTVMNRYSSTQSSQLFDRLIDESANYKNKGQWKKSKQSNTTFLVQRTNGISFRPPSAVDGISQKPFNGFLCNLVRGYLGSIPGGFFFAFLIKSFQGPPGPPKCLPGAIFAPFAKFLKNCSITFSIISHEHATGYNKYS